MAIKLDGKVIASEGHQLDFSRLLFKLVGRYENKALD